MILEPIVQPIIRPVIGDWRSRAKLLLDLVPDAAVALSTRQLSSAYKGPVVRVRRGSNNNEQDFTAKQVAAGTLVDYCNEEVVRYASDFSSGVDGYTGGNVVRGETARVDGISDGETSFDDVLRYTVTEIGTIVGHNRIQRLNVGSFNNLFRIKFRYFIPSGQALARINVALGDVQLSNGVANTVGEWAEFDEELDWGQPTHEILFFSAVTATNTEEVEVDDVFYIRDIEITQLTSNGFTVALHDQSGNGNTVTQTTAAAQPTMVEAGEIVTRNGKPVIRFDGVDDTFSTGGLTMPSQLTIVMPMIVRSFTADGRIVLFGTNNSTFVSQINGAPEGFVRLQNFLGTSDTHGRHRWDIPLNAFGVLTFVFDTVTFTNTHLYWNGEQLSRTIHTVPTGTPIPPTGNLINFAGPIAFSALDIGAFGYWPRIVTEEERKAAEKVFADYYGIPLA